MATVFTRNWYRWEKSPRGGRMIVPAPGARRTTIATGVSEEEARAICERWNSNNNPGPLSRKAEYEY